MLDSSFEPLAPERRDGLIGDILAVMEEFPFDQDNAVIETATLPFYDEYVLCKVSNKAEGDDSAFYLLWQPGHAILLDWTNEPIYTLNEEAPIVLEQSTLIPYAKFFFEMVRGTLGCFVIVEKPEDVPWLPEANDEEKKAVNEHLKPVESLGLTEDNFYTLVGTVLFKDALFRTEMKIAPFPITSTDPEVGNEEAYSTGQIALRNEELLLEDLPVSYEGSE